ncbi:RNA polymerase factor sigma-32 [Polyangium jinanense]|uniref:RNA polymerase factor sigma-32 n=1 Tax=Polyangium jinanense TaxID=2829994 RepID=A0A9X3WZ54_9BACT|nr:RNA polymerase factor sigma-32 [Polyangium jinanense]MDC3954691.1 RNA polymerase factor sigma-32 [Polyangium jinanense]MDC3980994.1 RNA polymerase factor sigma-32 [Polyangium jinanense]
MATKKTEPGKKTTKASAGGATKRGKQGEASAASKAERQASATSAEPAEGADGAAEDEDHAAEPEGADGEVVDADFEVVDEDADAGSLDKLPLVERKGASKGGGDSAISRTDPLQAYLREVQRHPLLTPEEEQKLTRHYAETQDVKTAARLVTANLRLVVKLAYEYRRAYKNIMDLIQEGNIGLMQAVKRYDPYRGVKLSSYAAWWIRAYILRFILNNWRLVKLGTTQAQRKLFFNLNKEKARLSAMGIEPTAGEIARRLSVDESEVVDMDRRLSSGEASLDAPVGDSEGRSVSRIDLMPSYTTGPDAAFESHEMDEMVRERLAKFRETLKGKDVIIFDKRMAAEDPLTLQELGDEFGISRERVRQLEARLTTRLREYLREELGDAVGGAS